MITLKNDEQLDNNLLTPKKGSSVDSLNDGTNVTVFKNNLVNTTSFFPRREYEENEAVSFYFIIFL